MKNFLVLIVMMLFTTATFANWSTTQKVDKMSGATSHYAVSPTTNADPVMSFPYQGVESNLAFGCTNNAEWFYIWFNKRPNLSGGHTLDGHDIHGIRVKFDTLKPWEETVIQRWGASSLQLNNDKEMLRHIKSAQAVLIEIDWYGQGETYFEYSLVGATSAINKARANCNN